MSFLGPTLGRAGRRPRRPRAGRKLNHRAPFHNGGEENRGEAGKGWVTEDLLRAIGESVKGLDAERMLDERESAAVTEYLATAQGEAQAAGANVTPTFGVGLSGGQLTKLEGAVSADGFREILDQLLDQG
jgi:protein-disulfide isomerase